MPNWDEARQTQILDWFESKSLEALPTMNVMRTPMYYSSPQDFATRHEEQYEKGIYKVRYLMFSYGGFVNSRTKGCEHDPIVNISYRAQLYRSTQQPKTAELNSHDLLVADLITLRNYFLNSLDIEQNKVVITDIKQIGQMIAVQESQFVVGDIGDWVNLQFDVEVNNE